MDESTKLIEIRRMGLLFREHWIATSHKGMTDPTRIKLDQVVVDEFDWPAVLVWRLRP
jgi:hypothetical protein